MAHSTHELAGWPLSNTTRTSHSSSLYKSIRNPSLNLGARQSPLIIRQHQAADALGVYVCFFSLSIRPSVRLVHKVDTSGHVRYIASRIIKMRCQRDIGALALIDIQMAIHQRPLLFSSPVSSHPPLHRLKRCCWCEC